METADAQAKLVVNLADDVQYPALQSGRAVPRAPWAVDIEVATAATPQRWTAELRIPLKAVSAEGHDHAIWGFNITRWDAARQEFSTWSGAVGNAYDPLSLGNLYLP